MLIFSSMKLGGETRWKRTNKRKKKDPNTEKVTLTHLERKAKKQQLKNNLEIKANKGGNSFSFNCAFLVCLKSLFHVNSLIGVRASNLWIDYQLHLRFLISCIDHSMCEFLNVARWVLVSDRALFFSHRDGLLFGYFFVSECKLHSCFFSLSWHSSHRSWSGRLERLWSM